MASLEHEHTIGAIRQRLGRGAAHSYLRDWIYGGIDGAVTTFAVVSGVAGASLAPGVVIILGAANLIADGFSMAASNFAGTATERAQVARAAAIERRHIDVDPAGEQREIREIFRAKGLAGAELDAVVSRITADPRLWVQTMLAEEYGLAPTSRSPWRAAASTFAAFGLAGAVPLLPYLAGMANPFAAAAAATLTTFAVIGGFRGHSVGASPWRAGAETLSIGTAASLLAYAAGMLLQRLV